MISASKAALVGGGPAASALAATGGMGVVLQDQVGTETDEQRKRRLEQQRIARLSGLNPAASALFGGGEFAIGRGY
jgi:hypothetical protein